MALTTLDFDAGPDGSAITTGNSGAAVVDLTGGGTAVYRTAAALSGAFGFEIVSGTGTTVLRHVPGGSSAQAAFSVAITVPATGAVFDPITVRDATGVLIAIIKRTAAGALEFWRTNGSFQATIFTAAELDALIGTQIRVTGLLDQTALTYTIRAYQGSTTTLLKQITGTVTAFGSTNPIGALQAAVSGGQTLRGDRMQLDIGGTTEPSPPGGNTPPTATIGAGTPTTATQNDTVPLRGTVSDAETSATAAWSITSWPATISGPPTITNPSSLTAASFVAVAPGDYTVRLTATDTQGSSSSVTRTITVAQTAPQAPATELVWDGSTWK